MIFEGMEVLGHPNHLTDVRDLMQSNSMVRNCGIRIPGGRQQVCTLNEPSGNRVHSITEREMENIPFDKAVEGLPVQPRAEYSHVYPASLQNGSISAITEPQLCGLSVEDRGIRVFHRTAQPIKGTLDNTCWW